MMRPTVIAFSMGLNILFIVFFGWYFLIHVGAASYYRKWVSPPSRDFINNPFYREKVEVYQALNSQLNADREYDVFVGDSLIEQFPIGELYMDETVLNRGINSDTTFGVLNRLPSNVNNIRIRNCFLLIGYNDLSRRNPVDIAEDIKNLVSRIHAKQCWVISLLPCVEVQKRRQILELNSILKERHGKRFVDVFNHFLDADDNLKEEYYRDGVHLKVAGYLALKQAIDRRLSAHTTPARSSARQARAGGEQYHQPARTASR